MSQTLQPSLSQLSVRVKVKNRLGSGFLYLPAADLEHVYILTAKHCLYGEKFKAKIKRTDISVFFADDTKPGEFYVYELSPNDEIIADRANSPDLAALRIERSKIDSRYINYQTCRPAHYERSEVNAVFKGYPFYTNNQEGRSVEVTNVATDSTPQVIYVSTNTPFSSEFAHAEFNVKGFSGSGLCIEIDRTYYPIAIVCQYEGAGNRFICHGLHDWLSVKIPGTSWYDLRSERLLPAEKFRLNVDKSISELGPRYSDFTFRTPLFDSFHFLAAGTDARMSFYEMLETLLTEISVFRQKMRELDKVSSSKLNGYRLSVRGYGQGRTFQEQWFHAEQLVTQLHSIAAMPFFTIPFDRLKIIGRLLYEAMTGLEQGRHNFINDNPTIGKRIETHFKGVSHLGREAERYIGFQQTRQYSLLAKPFVLIHGEPGSGKSHLLAEVALRRLQQGLPTLLFLGQSFRSRESVWVTILHSLNMPQDRPEALLEMLNKKGELAGQRLLVMIDAINEGAGIGLWKNQLHHLVESFRPYPFVSLVLTCRSTYLDLLFSPSLRDSLFTEIEHSGFAGYEVEAFHAFAKEYKLQTTSIPVLNSEFANPLFLKLLCMGLQREPIFYADNRIGIERVFRFYVAHVNEKLAENFNYDYVRLNLVQKSIDKFAAKLIEESKPYLPYEDSYILIEDSVSRFLSKKGYLDMLLHENVLMDVVIPIAREDWAFMIQFAYQRLGDHTIARHLIEKVPEDHRVAFQQIGIIAEFFSKYTDISNKQGIINALSIQWPDHFGEEFFESAPDDQRFQEAYIFGFFAALAWRRDRVRIESMNSLLTKLSEMSSKRLLQSFWSAVMELALDVNNTVNGFYLNTLLFNYSLAERDAIWTIFLHDLDPLPEYESNSASNLIKWAWTAKDEILFEPPVVLSGASAITWLMTSTNRGLRDHATKALINLFHFHPKQLIPWMKMFQDINDPYIADRMLAIAFGCAVRMKDQADVLRLATYVRKYLFEQDSVFPHILLRDYGRLILEYYNYLSPGYFNMQKARPPYRSAFPEHFPTNEEIDLLKNANNISEDAISGVRSILDSMVTEYGRGTSRYGDFGRYTFESALRNWQKIDTNKLSNLVVQWIMQEYGYDGKKFGRFDRLNNLNNDRIRNYHRERIGKKYQWIAFYRMLALVSDNKPFHPRDRGARMKPQQYKGPWDPYVRDIDPTFLVSPYRGKMPFWFKKPIYNKWDDDIHRWLQQTDDVPAPSDLVSYLDDLNREWFILEMHTDWRNRDDSQEGHTPYRNEKRFYLQIRSYVSRQDHYKELTRSLTNVSFFGRWMPESENIYELYNREYYWSPASKDLLRTDEIWQTVEVGDEIAGEVVVTSVEYLWEEEFDNSKIDGAVSIIKPSPFLYDLLELRDGDRDGEFKDKDGRVVCLDPSVNYDAPSCLLVRRELLIEKLKANELNIFWTLLGEKQILHGDEPGKVISGLIKQGASGISGRYHFSQR